MENKSLLDQWKAKKQKQNLDGNKIGKAPEGAVIPLSRSQQRLWFLQQLHPNSHVYNYAEIYTFTGALVKSALLESIRSIFSENAILRTYYTLENGEPRQQVNSDAALKISQYDLTNLEPGQKEEKKEEVFKKDTNTHFDLTQAPLVRVSLMKLSDQEHILLVTMHHILTDKWSMGIFRAQLAKKYLQAINGEIQNENLEIQYTDYAYWQKENGFQQSQVDYWMEKLSGPIPELHLPVDRYPTVHHSFNGNSHTQNFSKNHSQDILKLAKELEVTPYVFFLTAYYILLHKYSGQQDILVGSPISNRNEPILENMIGFFDETIVLRSKMDSSLTFKQLVATVKENTMKAFSNKDVPFDLLVKRLKPERSLGRNPFFRSMFIYHAVPETPSFGDDLKLTHSFFDNKVSKFDLTLYIANEDDVLSTSFEYSTDLFDTQTIERFQGHLNVLLEKITKAPDTAISELTILTPWEKELFFPKPLSSIGIFNAYKGIHDVILENAETKSHETAVAFGEKSITYGELGKSAEKVARDLLKITEGEKGIIGLCADRSIDMIVGLLGILKAGCAYLPIDPTYPKQRIHFMLTDAGANVVLAQESLKPILSEFKGPLVPLDVENHKGDGGSDKVKFPVTERNDLAYIIYTSGSTGKPKGVPISHGKIIGSTEGRLEFYPQNPKTFLLMSSIAFDSSKAGIFWTLCSGGKLVVAEKHLEQDMEKVGATLITHQVTHTLMLPSLYGLLLDHLSPRQLQSLKTVIVAGESCLPSVCKSHFEKLPGVSLYNEYGPTETTVWCIAHKIEPEDVNGNIPIGKAVAKSRILLLDDNLNHVPFGAIGEIYIGGPGLALSYLNRPELSSKAYIDHPFEKGSKLYKTGDLGRYTGQGNILFLGRADQQIKIRGHRIELDEIERVIDESGHVKKVVLAIEENNEGVPFDDKVSDSSNLWAYLTNHLAERDINDLLKYIEALDEKEKQYLLSQIP
ncbi:hypothetical protein FGF1_02380 [Flavobacteriaceae bacterium GF1]